MPGKVRRNILEQVLWSCKEALAGDGRVAIDAEGLRRFALGLDAQTVIDKGLPPSFPLRFESLEAEVTAIALWSMFDFGSGFDSLLFNKYRKTSRDIMQFGVLSMLLSNREVTVPFMQSFSMLEVQSHFCLDPSEDHQLRPGITVSRPGPLADLCRLIKQAMNETGSILADGGHKSLGDYIVSVLDTIKASGQSGRAAEFVEEVTDYLPTFADHGLVGSCTVSFCRKAQVLAGSLCQCFGPRDNRFDFDDVQELHTDSRDYVWAYLYQAGVFRVSDDFREKLQAGEMRDSSEMGRLLRAAVVAAGGEIIRFREGDFSARELGCYIVDIANDDRGLIEGSMLSSIGTVAF